jgi:hypothetical protein
MDPNPLRRRPAWCIAVLGAAVLLVIAGAGFVVWDRQFREAGPTNATDCPRVVVPTSNRPLSTLNVSRALLIGDSIMEQTSCSIARSLAGLGVRTTREGIWGSGLLNGPVDWNTRLPELLASEDPGVVVAIFVGNYPEPPVLGPDGRPLRPDSPRFYSAWQDRARQLVQLANDAGARFFWVSPPPFGDQVPFDRAERLFADYRSIEDSSVLEAGSILAGPEGEKVETRQSCGSEPQIRAFDGVHLTPDGARIYGQMIAHELSAELGVLTAPRPC